MILAYIDQNMSRWFILALSMFFNVECDYCFNILTFDLLSFVIKGSAVEIEWLHGKLVSVWGP
jgi:hypothetical protein